MVPWVREGQTQGHGVWYSVGDTLIGRIDET